jgi:hypothetical protein
MPSNNQYITGSTDLLLEQIILSNFSKDKDKLDFFGSGRTEWLNTGPCASSQLASL